ncbi:fibronectin type III domain-containing protein [Paenibacillus sp. J31TS4]|uniref:fibronectin type III domain-containing protein n=1 Tax=Paenibacillus sp. J31TS4 TaxID=2807195 RepID=UPI001BD05C74|nr:fibronectin type III domain-containing protein [Paenibacillus sp. J31TS4]
MNFSFRSSLSLAMSVMMAASLVGAGGLSASASAQDGAGGTSSPGTMGTKPPIVLADFENGIQGWSKDGARYTSVSISAETDPDIVRFGSKSLKLEYDFTGQLGTSGAYALPDEDIVIDGYPEKIGMWFYGANDDHWIRAQLKDGEDKAFPIDFTSEDPGVDWTGWKYIEAAVPKGKPLPLKLDLAVRVMEPKDSKKNKAVVYVDNIRAVYGPTDDDLVNPTIDGVFPADGSTTKAYLTPIRAAVKDDENGSGIDPASVRMKLDGELVTPSLDGGTVTYTPGKPLAGGYHEVQLRVKDKFGNPADKTWTFFVEGQPGFVIGGAVKANAGSTFQVDLSVSQSSALQGAQLRLLYDPNKLKVVDAEPKVDGIQAAAVHARLGKAELVANQADNNAGSLTFGIQDLPKAASLPKDGKLATVTFEVNSSATGTTDIRLVDGLLQTRDGSSMPAFHLPQRIELGHELALAIDGVYQEAETTFKVTDAKGKPVKDTEISLLASPEVSHSATVSDGGAPIRKAADASSEVLEEAAAGSVYLATRESNGFTEVYTRTGVKGWIASGQLTLKPWQRTLGYTDKNGELRSGLLTLAPLRYTIQAKSKSAYSAPMPVQIVSVKGSHTPEQVVLTWSDNPKTTQSITWRTMPQVKDTVVQYAKADGFAGFNSAPAVTVKGASSTMLHTEGAMQIHTALLTGLAPGTEYVYRVGDGSGEAWSKEHTFRTEADTAQPFSFLFVSDSQSDKKEGFDIHRDVVSKGLERFPDARFLLHTGDFVEDGAKLIQWEQYMASMQNIGSKLPIVGTLGNHDVYGDGEDVFRQLFQFPENGPEGEKEWVYSFDYGDAHFAVLNSEAGTDSMAKQAAWLKEDMAKTGEKWKIVLFHRAPYFSNNMRGPDSTLTLFAPVVEELGVDLVLVGHDHAYARTYPMKDGKPVTSGESGTLYLIGGSSGPKFYPETKYPYLDVLYGEDIQVYTGIQVDESGIRIEAWNRNGQLVDRHTMTKAK